MIARAKQPPWMTEMSRCFASMDLWNEDWLMMKGVCPMRLDAISLRTDAKQSSSSPPKSKVMNLPTRLIHHIDGYPCSFSAWHHNNSGVNCRTFPISSRVRTLAAGE
jgi:hypothetical protein